MTTHIVTSALPYINGTKHLGNLVGSLLPADVHARWLRRRGHDVAFVCGTDEHGAPAELAAQADGVDPSIYCDRLHQVQRTLFDRLLLSFDHFGRTSSPTNHALTVQLYEELRDAGFIARRTTRQLYAPADGRFLPDRYVVGRCPRCDGPARGDQCEACSLLLEPTELVAPRSALSGSADLELRETEHAYLLLSKLQDRVAAHVEAADHWPDLTRQVARAWLAEGLRDRCITRDLSWGVPVPDLPGKVFYCWFDAPIAYLSLTRELRPDADALWALDGDVRITQFLGKDNLPFHTVLFPATLLGVGRRIPDQIKSFHWLSWYGEKFSTSRGVGLFLDAAVELLPAEVWRWGLLAQAPESADSAFTWEGLKHTIDKDLVGQLGNFVQRTGRLAERLGDRVPRGGADGPDEVALHEAVRTVAAELDRAHADLRFRQVIEALRALSREANRYVDRREPWRLVREDPDQAAVALRTCLELWRTLAAATEPVLPHTASVLFDALGLTREERALDVAARHSLAGRPFRTPPPLFQRIEVPDRDPSVTLRRVVSSLDQEDEP